MKNPVRYLPSLLAITMASPVLFAQEQSATLTVGNIIRDGGSLMYLLLALSVLAVIIILFALITFRRNVLMPPGTLRALHDANGDLEAMAEECSGKTSALAAIVAYACAQARACGDKEAAPAVFQKTMEEAGSRQSARLWGQLQYLADVATVAPMVGLLGTVWGMMISFTGLQNDIMNKADRLAGGVATAMYTTFGGLVIGIIALAAYALLRGRLAALIGSLESECSLLANRYSSRCRHTASGEKPV